jgi:hypothetical protein
MSELAPRGDDPDASPPDLPETVESTGSENTAGQLTVSSKIDLVLDQLSKVESATNRKDKFDKFHVIATAFIAFVALLFSFLTNYRDSVQRQAIHQSELAQRDRVQAENLRVQELQIINAFLPYLTGRDEKKKELAVRAVSHLTNPELAAVFAGIEPSPGTAAGLNTLRRSPRLAPNERARIDTVLNRFPSGSRDVLEILDVPGGGLRSDTVFRTDTAVSAPPALGRTRGKGTCGLWQDERGGYYCSGPCLEGQACGVVEVGDP